MSPKPEEIQKIAEAEEKGDKGKKEKRLKSKDAEKGTDSSKSSAQEPLTLPERKGGPHQKLLIKPGGLWYELVSIGRLAKE